jgi:hypothetical protein
MNGVLVNPADRPVRVADPEPAEPSLLFCFDVVGGVRAADDRDSVDGREALVPAVGLVVETDGDLAEDAVTLVVAEVITDGLPHLEGAVGLDRQADVEGQDALSRLRSRRCCAQEHQREGEHRPHRSGQPPRHGWPSTSVGGRTSLAIWANTPLTKRPDSSVE